MGKYCSNCYRPANNEDVNCEFCDNHTFHIGKRDYSLLQWEHFIGKHGPVGSHDFSPWEFDESGHITRGGGTQGTSGPSGCAGNDSKNNVKKLHAKNNVYKK